MAASAAASVHDPGSGRTMTLTFDSAFRECVFYIPRHRQALCIEPYTLRARSFPPERAGSGRRAAGVGAWRCASRRDGDSVFVSRAAAMMAYPRTEQETFGPPLRRGRRPAPSEGEQRRGDQSPDTLREGAPARRITPSLSAERMRLESGRSGSSEGSNPAAPAFS